MQDKSEQEVVRLEVISKRYDIPLSTLRRWASQRRFPLYKISNRVRVSLSEFDDWVKQYRINGGET